MTARMDAATFLEDAVPEMEAWDDDAQYAAGDEPADPYGLRAAEGILNGGFLSIGLWLVALAVFVR